MKRAKIVFGEVGPSAESSDGQGSAFSVLSDEYELPAGRKLSNTTVSPWILKLAGLSVVFVVALSWFAPSSSQTTPIQEKIRNDKILEQYRTYRARAVPYEPPEAAQRLMDSLEKQVQAVARAEAVGNKAAAKHELTKLILIDGGDTRSPLYKFCIERAKEYQ